MNRWQKFLGVFVALGTICIPAWNTETVSSATPREPDTAMVDPLLTLPGEGVLPGSDPIHFGHILVQNGLYDTFVNAVTIDSTGYAWIGTGSALQRWDGTRMINYVHDPNDPSSLASGEVRSIAQDGTGDIWVVVADEVNRLDVQKSSFTRYAVDQASISIDKVVATQDGRLLATGWGLGYFDIQADRFVPAVDRFADQEEYIRYEGQLSDGRLLVSSDTAVYVVDLDERMATEVALSPTVDRRAARDDVIAEVSGNVLTATDVSAVVEAPIYGGDSRLNPESLYVDLPFPEDEMIVDLKIDAGGRIWVSTEVSGAIMYNPSTKIMTHHLADEDRESSLLSNFNSIVAVPDDGTVWLASYGRGLSIFAPDAQGMELLRESSKPASLSSDRIHYVFLASDNSLWVGHAAGVDVIADGKISQPVAPPADAPDPDELGGVAAIAEQDDGKMLIGTIRNGLQRYDPVTGHTELLAELPWSIKSMYRHPSGDIWIGAAGGGIYRVRSGVDEVETVVPMEDDRLFGTDVVGITGTRSGDVIAVSGIGIVLKFDADGKEMMIEDIGDSPATDVKTLTTGPDGTIWAGTKSGLAKLQSDGKWTVETIIVDERRLSINSVLFDDATHAWLGTSYGLHRYNLDTRTSLSFNAALGIQGFEFSPNAALQTESAFYFGGTSGLNAFDPMRLARRTSSPVDVPEIIYDNSAHVQIIHGESSDQPDAIVPSDVRSITIEFAVLDYVNPVRNHFRYRLKGFDEDWIDADFGTSSKTYTNMPPGEYILEIETGWDDATVERWVEELRIQVEPKWWETWLARAGFVLSGALVVLAFVAFRTRRTRRRNRELRERLREREHLHSQLQQLHTEVQAHAERIQALIDSSPGAIVLLDAQHRVIMSNDPQNIPAPHELGIVSGQPVVSFLDVEVEELLRDGGRWRQFDANVGGIDRTLSVYAARSGDDPASTWVLAYNDVTEQVAEHRRLESQRRMTDLGHFAAGIAHDLNNVLAVIMMSTELIEATAGDNDAFAEYTARISQYSDTAREMIRQVLDFSRSNHADLIPLEAGSVFEDIADGASQLLGTSVDFSSQISQEARVAMIESDRVRLHRLVFNLVVNARDALNARGSLGEHGRISMDVSVVSRNKLPDDAVSETEINAAKWVCVTVSDNGSGIPPKMLSSMFEPFQTTKSAGAGAGLGLAQVYGIVMAHRGLIHVSSTVNVGTRFCVYIPVMGAELPPQIVDVEGSLGVKSVGEPCSVLIVDDNAALLVLVEASLENAGYKVATARDGNEGFRIWKDGRFDVIVTDMVMPGMCGCDLVNAVREIDPYQAIVVVTGGDPSNDLGGDPMASKDVDCATEEMPADVQRLPKPIGAERLVEAIQRATIISNSSRPMEQSTYRDG